MADLLWTANRGRNGFDAPVAVAPDACVEARNILLYQAALGQKRGGSVAITITGVTAPINAMAEFVPGQDVTAAELYVVDSSATTKILRCAGGSSFSNLTLKDNVSSEPSTISWATLNGKLYVAYHSGVNRLHVLDPGFSTSTLRRAGVGTPAAATVANAGGAGTYAATIRYYRIAFTEQRSGVTIRRSLLGPAVSFTPDGSHVNATVTKPASLSEGETHWEVYGSPDGVLYYVLAADSTAIAVGTTTYVDTALPSTYANNTASPSEGANTPFPSTKALATDGTRLLGFGVWETSAGDSLTPKNGRVYFGPVLDASSVNDDERINNTTTLQGYIDIARNSGAVDRGITPRPVNNAFYVFQSTGVYSLIPNESATAPYRRVVVDSQVGNLCQQAIVMAQDRNGQPCAYFLDPVRGPYVVGGSMGLRWCGKDVKDLWDTVNLGATTLPAWGIWQPTRYQVIFAVATGVANEPNLMLVLNVMEQHEDEDGDLRGGWTTWDGDFAAARSGVMFSTALTATRAVTRTPYVGTATKLLRYDESVTQDDSTNVKGYVLSGARVVSTQALRVNRAYVAAGAANGVSLQQSLVRNLGDETTRASTVSLSPVGSETAVLRKFEDAALEDAWTIQVQLGDASAAAARWVLHQYRAEITSGSPL